MYQVLHGYSLLSWLRESHRWQKEFFEGGHVVFERRGADPAARQAEQKIERLERKLREKDEVLGELMAEYVAVKKTLGGV